MLVHLVSLKVSMPNDFAITWTSFLVDCFIFRIFHFCFHRTLLVTNTKCCIIKLQVWILWTSTFLNVFSFFQTVQHNEYGSDRYAQEFGIKISDKLASVEARILPAPRVKENLLNINLFVNCQTFIDIH